MSIGDQKSTTPAFSTVKAYRGGARTFPQRCEARRLGGLAPLDRRFGNLRGGIDRSTPWAYCRCFDGSGFIVYAINPKQLDRLRDRFSVAGAKDETVRQRSGQDAIAYSARNAAYDVAKMVGKMLVPTENLIRAGTGAAMR